MMDEPLATLRAQYESGEISEAVFRERLMLLVPVLPAYSSLWQRFCHWRVAQRLWREQQRWIQERTLYLREQQEKAAHDALIEAWIDAYRQLSRLLPKRAFHHDFPPDPRLSSISGASKAENRRVQIHCIREDTQKLIWDLECLDKLAPSAQPITTPAEALARLPKSDNP